MFKYCFILGRNNTLSLAEVQAVLARLNYVFKTTELGQDVLILETEKEWDLDSLVQKMGGIIKAGEVLSEETGKFQEVIENRLNSDLIKTGAHQRKIIFGASLYLLGQAIKNFSQLKDYLDKKCLEIKKELKKQGIGSRYVASREKVLSSVVIQKNQLIKKGIEVLVLVCADKIYFARTKTIQDFESYSFRDYQRPGRDIKAGLIPPKLAQIMINLAGASYEETIFDPFCGSGTILQEAVLLGYKNVLGSDRDFGAVNNAEKNLEWLIQNYRIDRNDLRLKIFQHDIRNDFEEIKLDSIAAMVTEPYLGPPIVWKIREEKLKAIVRTVSELYLDFFKQAKKILKKDGKISIIFPIFKYEDQFKQLEIIGEIKKMGYRIERLTTDQWKNSPLVKITGRGSIIYSRTDQRVLREIFVFNNQ
jgi:tRNA G10  N-methylase Trm11